MQKLKKFVSYKIRQLKNPYLRINKLPKERPSIKSIYFFLNQLGKNQPVGLTHNLGMGYHELPFDELKFEVNRNDLKPRIARICSAIDVKDKLGLDFGSSIGGISFALQLKGAKMLGLERDKPCLDVANEAEGYFKTGTKFLEGNIDLQQIEKALKLHSKADGTVDFSVWFSSFNWVVEAIGKDEIKKLLMLLSSKCKHLIMDSAIGGKGQPALDSVGITDNETFKSFMLNNSNYVECKSIGKDNDWYDREVMIFS